MYAILQGQALLGYANNRGWAVSVSRQLSNLTRQRLVARAVPTVPRRTAEEWKAQGYSTVGWKSDAMAPAKVVFVSKNKTLSKKLAQQLFFAYRSGFPESPA